MQYNKNSPILSEQDIYAHTAGLISSFNPPLSHEFVAEEFLSSIQPVDFQKIDGFDGNDKAFQAKLYVPIIDKTIEQIEKSKLDLCIRDGFIYLYNGQYWLRWDREQLQRFLGRAASRLGVDNLRSKDHIFRDRLYKQFMATAVLIASELQPGVTQVNLLNGTLEIYNGRAKLKPFKADDFLTYQLNFSYDPKAECPRFREFLNEVLPDQTLQNVLAEYIGWVFVPVCQLKLEKCLILYGTGANGKSVFFDVIDALLGANNITSFSLRNLCESNGQYRAKLSGKLLNYTSELSGGLETDIFKQLVSGEPVEARQLYKEPFILNQYARLAFNANELPRQVEQSDGFFRRFIIIPFDITIPEDKQDRQLAQKIISQELPGVLNWVLEGLHRLLTQKQFTYSETISSQANTFRRDTDSTALFLEEEGYIKDPHKHLPVQELYREYESYCHYGGYKPVSRNSFLKRLQGQGVRTKRTSKGQEAYIQKQPEEQQSEENK